MNGFFKPLRRKIGVVTLVVACMFAAAWILAKTVIEEADTGYCFTDEFQRCEEGNYFHQVVFFQDRFLFAEMRRGRNFHFPRYSFTFYYWLIVTPLTLVSLWLLLSKPRESTSKKITQLMPESVA